MSNPLRLPTTPAAPNQYNIVPEFYFTGEEKEKMKSDRKKYKSVESLTRALAPLFDFRNSFIVPGEATTNERQAGELARSAEQGFSARVRSSGGRLGVVKFVSNVPATYVIPGQQAPLVELIGTALRTRVSASNDTVGCLQRLLRFYPSKAARRSNNAIEPITVEEAQDAMLAAGKLLPADLPQELLSPVPLQRIGDVEGVTANPKASNGLPVLGKWGDEEAQSRVMGLALSLRNELVQVVARNGLDAVVEWKEEGERSRPYLFTVMGKCKSDMYSGEKVVNQMMRYYNVLPRQMSLIMAQSSQTYSGLTTSCIDDPSTHSAQKASLAHGGAARLVEVLQHQLDTHGCAWVHAGDDTWLAVEVGGDKLVFFSLDCSSFDITQRSEVTATVDWEIMSQLASIDRPSAFLWYSYMRRRNVVLAKTVVVDQTEGGVSGMLLQSERNDVLMEVFCQRLLTRGHGTVDYTNHTALLNHVQRVGSGLGFTVRLEDYAVLEASTMVEALQLNHFLFLGYRFWADQERKVYCYADLPRFLSKLQYPTVTYDKDKTMINEHVAFQVAGTYINMGIPPPELRTAYHALEVHALDLLTKNPPADTMLEDHVFAALVRGSGLYRAVENRESVWIEANPELESESVFVPASNDWTDMMDQDLDSLRREYGLPVIRQSAIPSRPPSALPRVNPLPVRLASVGRQPATTGTAVSGPRVRTFEPRASYTTRTTRRRQRRGDRLGLDAEELDRLRFEAHSD